MEANYTWCNSQIALPWSHIMRTFFFNKRAKRGLHCSNFTKQINLLRLTIVSRVEDKTTLLTLARKETHNRHFECDCMLGLLFSFCFQIINIKLENKMVKRQYIVWTCCIFIMREGFKIQIHLFANYDDVNRTNTNTCTLHYIITVTVLSPMYQHIWQPPERLRFSSCNGAPSLCAATLGGIIT